MKNIQRVFLAAVFALSTPSIASDAIAFLSNLKGDVAVDGNPRPLLLAELVKGQRITLGRDATASVMFIATGKEYLLKGPAEYQVRDTEVTGSTPMPPMVRSTEWRASSKVLVQVAQASAASVRMRSLAKARDEPPARLVFPTRDSIATLQPTFRWLAEDPRQSGELSIHVVGQDATVHAAKVTGASYRLPMRLKPDTEYAWTYAVAGSEVGSGRFRTVSADALEQVERRRPADKAQFSDRLLFALMLQEMGATQEAREAWARLAAERSDLPELSALAK
jgi:hypothetical protein